MLRYLVIFSAIGLLAAQDQCAQEKNSGRSGCGVGGGQRFFFHKATRTCQPFYFQGCDGNGNNFASKEQCLSTCQNAQSSDAPSNVAAVCSTGAYAAGATSDALVSCKNCPNGYRCEKNLCCPTKEFTCKMNYDAGHFGNNSKHTPRYFYSNEFHNCMLFTFYGRGGNANNFATFNECKKMCA